MPRGDWGSVQGGDKTAILAKCNEMMHVEEKSPPDNGEDFCKHVTEKCAENVEQKPDLVRAHRGAAPQR